jgi:sn-glycerol 3-phosphate transport system substrate-binding protein
MSLPVDVGPRTRRFHFKEDIMKSLIARTVILVVVAALVLLGGTASVQAKTEIQFWHAMQGQLGEALDELVKLFNQSQEEFEVKAICKGMYPEVLASSLAAYRLNKQPHIVQVFDVGTQSMVLSDAKVPIVRLMKQEHIPVDWADFRESITGYYSRDGKLFSLPFNVTTPILYYNKDVFKKAGLEDKPPATWMDVETASRKILASGAAKCGFSAPALSWSMLENTFAWHDQPFATNQNGYTGLDTKLRINSNFGLMHIGALFRWNKENIFFYDGPEGESLNMFLAGDCAMVVQTSGSIGDFEKSIKFDWGTGQLPHWGAPYPKGNTSLGGASLWVLRGREPAEYKGVAQFMKFIVEPQQQVWLVASTGWLPITNTAVKHLQDGAFFKKHPERLTAVSQLLNAKPTKYTRGLRLGNFAQVREVIELELDNILTGKKTVKEGLDAAVTRGNAILWQFGVTHGAPSQGEI